MKWLQCSYPDVADIWGQYLYRPKSWFFKKKKTKQNILRHFNYSKCSPIINEPNKTDYQKVSAKTESFWFNINLKHKYMCYGMFPRYKSISFGIGH